LTGFSGFIFFDEMSDMGTGESEAISVASCQQLLIPTGNKD